VNEIIALRRQRLCGKHIAKRVGVSPATVSRVLRRAGLSRMRDLDPVEPVRRYERLISLFLAPRGSRLPLEGSGEAGLFGDAVMAMAVAEDRAALAEQAVARAKGDLAWHGAIVEATGIVSDAADAFVEARAQYESAKINLAKAVQAQRIAEASA